LQTVQKQKEARCKQHNRLVYKMSITNITKLITSGFSVWLMLYFSPVILSQNGGQPWTNCNRSKLNWFCILNMSWV